MTQHLQLIAKKLEHLERMRGYLAYSLDHVSRLMPILFFQRACPSSTDLDGLASAAGRLLPAELQSMSPTILNGEGQLTALNTIGHR